MALKLVLDTSAYSALMRGDASVAHAVRSSEHLVIPAVVLGELLYGFRMGSRDLENRRQLREFLSSPYVSFKSIDEPVCERYALVMQQLREKGRPIPSNDLWIAAHTLAEGADLLTLDSHFQPIEGLSVMEF